MSGAPNKWTEIQVTNQKSKDIQDLEINLDDDPSVEEENNNNDNQRVTPSGQFSYYKLRQIFS